MTRVVWKFRLDVRDAASWRLAVTAGAKVVAIRGASATDVDVWIELAPAGRIHTMELFIVGTGQPVPQRHEHCGSAFCDPFVWHVYRLPEETR